MSPHLIELRDVSKSYITDDVETPVLHNVHLTIERGEFVAIMGPSGSGKSTLMHILGFLDLPTSGEYFFRDEPTMHMDEDALARVRSTSVSFVFQAFNLLPRTTVFDNVLLPLLYHPTIPAEERNDRVARAIEAVGLSDHTRHLSNQLSGGQQQRVAIARSLVTDPDVIFADEPTGNLDTASGAQVMDVLRRLHASGRTIILVTHEATTASYAGRIIHIQDGRVTSDQSTLQA
jgi:putative ABC transport system ATP-binding protein